MAINNAEDLRRNIEYQANVACTRMECGGDFEKVTDKYLELIPKLHGRSWRVARRIAKLENARVARELMLADDAFQGRL